jgi:cellulose synthase/poly-beta-1,6-N-acetylglucosamine synthase-like glycosyltransferase
MGASDPHVISVSAGPGGRDTVTSVDALGAFLVGIEILFLLFITVAPLRRNRGDDRGDGMSDVVLPKPRPVHGFRIAAFFVIFFLASALAIGVRPGLPSVYQSVVAALSEAIVRAPAAVGTTAHHLAASIRILVALDILCLAMVIRATIGRRLIVAAHAALYLALGLGLDTASSVLGTVTGLPIGPYSLEGTLLNLLAGVLVIMRIVFTTMMLPRSVRVPRSKPRSPTDSLILGTVVLICLAIGAMAVGLLAQPQFERTDLPILISFAAYPLFFAAIWALVLLIGWAGGSRPPVAGDDRPPLDVIIPAYNEESGIARTLETIDRAAARYGGLVRVIVADDGSTDDTVSIVKAKMSGFRSALGDVVGAGHQGKSAALNRALSETTADIVVRIDADVVVDERAFLFTAPWFRDPRVGTVGCFMFPKPEGTSWFHRMRLFECLFAFGFARPAQTVVDGVNCIPGTYAAFRRQPVVEFGGFVVGMNGEDADLTMNIGRGGYRAVVDRRAIAYEDVPQSVKEFREQRTRWNRAGTQVFARHSPFTAGLVGPRLWFSYMRIISVRFTSVARPLVLLHAIQLAILVPTIRRNLWFVFVFYLLSAAPMFAVAVVLSVRYGRWRKLPWLLLWYPFSLLRRMIVLESLLTLPTRPVTWPEWARSPVRQGALAPDQPGVSVEALG